MRTKQELEKLIAETKIDLEKAKERFYRAKTDSAEKVRRNTINEYKSELKAYEYERELAKLEK